MKTRKAAELDRIFDDGNESILDYADMSTLRKPNKEKDEQRSLSLQVPEWLVEVLDREAARVGISRQAVIKVWLTERADRMRAV
ncbi:antitoxin [Bifidobacterium sp. ESL0745]|uniref:type II toxin-antitoxin system BrnA family antitoxin n=1 Tax=Bifidobacterium sp. ESL0745 TaxID=2983226 RepID=UPI0023F87B5C|nr:antitoxin [Bifidobacterium sp. ESL0745]MDF7664573.1 antitoxin [Bifidobacterium sp. ESL0745]